MPDSPSKPDAVSLMAGIVAAYVSHNALPRDALGGLIQTVHDRLTMMAREPTREQKAPARVPATPVQQSVRPDYLICLDDGKKFKSLKRHLRSLGMTPEQYRAKWDLPPDYPMIAPNYSAARSELAKTIGLRVRERRGRFGKATRETAD